MFENPIKLNLGVGVGIHIVKVRAFPSPELSDISALPLRPIARIFRVFSACNASCKARDRGTLSPFVAQCLLLQIRMTRANSAASVCLCIAAG